ncbi:MAG TPA: hypothetical protein VG268_13520 [Streptosporangiaceae bacterium]|jgi:hypothetical protein|nr:hypothetical protein [Streptosporangiaceae bacterium]
MGMVTVYILYLLISVVLTIVTATILARSGRTFLTHMLGGDDALGQAISRLFAVGFYLLNLGFVILAMRSTGSVHSTQQAIEVLSTKLGEALLVIGALHLINVFALTRVGRRAGRPPVVRWRPADRGEP